jgi:tRNA(Ile)-lysidine synthase
VSAAADGAPVSAAEATRLFADLAEVPALVVAVSGGPDSTALLLLAARWSRTLTRPPRLLCVTVDHGLRPESAKEAEDAARFSRAVGVEHHIVRWNGQKPATGVQNAARAARYGLLANAARDTGARHVITAHTQDDQAETVLMRMARGSGLTGLSGMLRTSALPGAADILLVRPFLDVPKARLLATLNDASIPFVEDPSNRDPRFTRVRLRQLARSLAGEGLDAERFAVLARRMARADAALEAAVDDASASIAVDPPRSAASAFDAAAFAALQEEIALRLLGRAITQANEEERIELAKLEALFAALQAAPERPRFRRTLAGALVTRDGGRLIVERAPPRRSADGSAFARIPGDATPRPIVKEIEAIPLAGQPDTPTLTLGRSGSLQIARTTVAAGPPARHKGRQ